MMRSQLELLASPAPSPHPGSAGARAVATPAAAARESHAGGAAPQPRPVVRAPERCSVRAAAFSRSSSPAAFLRDRHDAMTQLEDAVADTTPTRPLSCELFSQPCSEGNKGMGNIFLTL